jgi:redox-sensitive bicupin YhaK (pirin superfamily)
MLSRPEQDVPASCTENAMALLLTGEPIDEPVVGHGPFVMNTQDEIRQAIRDYQSGRMGRLLA